MPKMECNRKDVYPLSQVKRLLNLALNAFFIGVIRDVEPR